APPEQGGPASTASGSSCQADGTRSQAPPSIWTPTNTPMRIAYYSGELSTLSVNVLVSPTKFLEAGGYGATYFAQGQNDDDHEPVHERQVLYDLPYPACGTDDHDE